MWMVCKGIGVLCVLAAGVLTGMELEKGLKRRWMILREMTEILEFLEKEMVYHRTPMGEALGEAARRCKTCLGEVFHKAASLTEERSGTSFQIIWQEAVENTEGLRLLEHQESELLSGVAAALCNPDTVMQKTLIGTYRERFAGVSLEMERTYREKGMLYRRLAAAAGVFLAILLL